MLQLCYSLEQLPWVVYVTSDAGIISVIWLIHYLGIFLLVGTGVFVDLRVLGFAGKRQHISPLAGQLFPLTWTGLCMIVPSGLIMFSGQATIFYPAMVFRIKMLVMLLAVALGVVVQSKVPEWNKLIPLPAGAKLLAGVSLLFWVGAILSGLEVAAFLPI